MNKGAKIAIGATGATILGLYLVGRAKKAAALKDNIFVDIEPTDIQRSGLSAIVTLKIHIQNLSGISLTIKNLWTRLAYKNKAGVWVDVGRGQADIKSIALKDQETSTFNLTLKISGFTTLQALISGATELKAVSNFTALGQPIEYPTPLPLPNFRDMIKGIFGMNGLDGYQPFAGYQPFVGSGLAGLI